MDVDVVGLRREHAMDRGRLRGAGGGLGRERADEAVPKVDVEDPPAGGELIRAQHGLRVQVRLEGDERAH